MNIDFVAYFIGDRPICWNGHSYTELRQCKGLESFLCRELVEIYIICHYITL